MPQRHVDEVLPERRLVEVIMGERRENNVNICIKRVWRMRSEPKRIHYNIVWGEDDDRHGRRLYEDSGTALYRLLEEAL